MFLSCGAGEDSWESLGLQRDPTSPSERKSVLNIHWKGWDWSWNSNPLATWCKELTHLKRPWCWERLRAGGEGDNRGCDGWMASLTQWTWVWANSGRWWWTGRPGGLQSMGSQRVQHNWANEQQQQAGHKWMHSVLGSLLYIDLCICFSASIILITETLQDSLKSRSMTPLAYSFFLKIPLQFGVFCGST